MATTTTDATERRQPSLPDTRHLVLVGMMGSGKTTVGRLVAERLGRPYLDNDDLVRSIAGEEPAVIRNRQGEDALHGFEAAALDLALAGSDAVVASAAAAVVEDAPSRTALGDASVVWLRARPATLSERIGSGLGRRDEATDPEWLAGRANARQRLYAEVADRIIDVDERSPTQVADEIVDWVAGTAVGASVSSRGGGGSGRSEALPDSNGAKYAVATSSNDGDDAAAGAAVPDSGEQS